MKRKGYALIFTLILALLMVIPVTMLFSGSMQRNFSMKGEVISDRAFITADATIEMILNKINTFGFPLSSPPFEDEDLQQAVDRAKNYIIAQRLAELNGGNPDINDPLGSYNDIINNVSVYLFNSVTNEWYALWDENYNRIASVGSVGPNSPDLINKKVKNLQTGELSYINSIDSNFKTDNIWFEVDTNTVYWPGTPDKWVIKATAYNLSKPEVYRTIEVHAVKGNLSTTNNQSEKANGNWYTRKTDSSSTTVYYSDFSGLYHTKVYFGKFEVTKGMIRSDSDLYMGGWAQDPVYAHGTVYDKAIDANWASTGRFGPNQKNLSWAKSNGYATNNYPAAQWPNGDLALNGSTSVRNPADPNGGLQDKALDGYYVNGNATIVFSVENGVGYVSINGNKLPMPSNGAIYVEGNATVSGTIKGRCSVGAGNNIYIGGNILYDTPPRVDKDTPVMGIPDSLGLISYNSILIPYSTFLNNPHLEIDAAMLAVHGSFGLTNDYPWRPMDTSGRYFAKWYGAQAEFNTDNAPCFVNGNLVKGYEIQQTFYDYNLYDYGAPPFYPVVNKRQDEGWTVRYEVVTDQGILGYLRNLDKSQLIIINPADSDYNPSYPYKYYYNGNWYYYGTSFNVNYQAVASFEKTQLYRVIYKENIAQSVKP